MKTYDHNQDPLTETHIDAKWVECSHAYSCKMGERVKNHATSTWEPKWESDFHLIKFSIPQGVILESTLNGKTRIVNVGTM